MASNLYEVLGVPKDANVEQIRKAYKKKALKTHPDKLPPTMSEEERQVFGNKFKEISHACEILTDPKKRSEYDMHGVWPPPPQPENNASDSFSHDNMPGRQRGQRSHTFPDQFFTHHHHPYSNFTFQDPRELFESIIRELRELDDIFAPGPSSLPGFPFHPFGGNVRSQSLFSNSFFPPMPPMPPMPTFPFGPFSPMFENNQGHGSFSSVSSETIITTSVNGVTQTTHTKRNADGTEHVTRKYSDGREVYTINGMEQPAHGHLPQTDHEPAQPPSNQSQSRAIRHHSLPQSQSQSRPHHRSTMPSYSQPHRIQSRHSTLAQPQRTLFDMQVTQEPDYDTSPPPYPGSSTHYTYTQTSAERPVYRERERRINDRYTNGDANRYDDRHHYHRSSYRV
ncbi:DnaJ-domain-containing protein [Macrolepiota fuliginosa MF-IS2]|uniref:DnaJ-domain-containing protein n=1 Tax=Macrolepiota fuliginosa MF-IS2 TaxID=1400762 RepID=A0A9P5XMJ8_9AGAR|nr:DnaJ-domain-containing protein [Macrolepiota fuliginosa MF-IS2]